MSRLTFKTVLRVWPWALAGGLFGAILAYSLSQFVTPMYQSTAVLYYALSFGNTAGDLAQGSSYTESQMLSFGELATSQLVLDPVIKQESLAMTSQELANQISVATPRGTMIMQITVSSADPQTAARIANAVASEQQQVVESIAPRQASGDSAVSARIIQQGIPPLYPYTPNTKLNMVLGALIFALLLGGGALLARILDQRIKSPEDLETLSERPFLGTIREIEKGQNQPLVMLQDPTSPVAEDFRQLQVNLRYATMSREPVILVVSSAVSGEGKSTVAINLATVLAEAGQKVLLIDADLRRPRVAEYAQMEGSVGLTDVLVGQQVLGDAVQTLGASGATVLTSGPMPPNPGEMLGSVAMSELLKQASREYTTIVIDTAPVLAVADAVMMTHKADGLVLVTRNRRTTTTSLEKCFAKLDSAGVNVLGVILNGARRGRDKNLKYYEYTPSRTPGTAHRKRGLLALAESVSDLTKRPGGPPGDTEAGEAPTAEEPTPEASDAIENADEPAAESAEPADADADAAAQDNSAGKSTDTDDVAPDDDPAIGYADGPEDSVAAGGDRGKTPPRTRQRKQVMSGLREE